MVVVTFVLYMIYCRDVTYVTSSGSIIAVAGNSSNGVNVVIWDTLAPPTSSRASIICHEGRTFFLFNTFQESVAGDSYYFDSF